MEKTRNRVIGRALAIRDNSKFVPEGLLKGDESEATLVRIPETMGWVGAVTYTSWPGEARMTFDAIVTRRQTSVAPV
jgi:hypothetical protein